MIDISSTKLPSLADIRASVQREVYLSQPNSWITDRLKEHFWSKQREIIHSVQTNRRTAVKSGHNTGKSFSAAAIVCWWLDTRAPGTAFVVTSAPTWKQVRAILWREISRAHAKAKLHGRLNQTEWWTHTVPSDPNSPEELIAFGIKPDNNDPDAFQGIHAQYVLVVLDEACGIAKPLWDSADSLISNESSRILAIGNPDDPNTEFAEVCKPGSGWNVIRISAFDTPNFTAEPVPEKIKHHLVSRTWEEEKRRKWGKDNPLYVSKVLGEFPDISTDGLIPIKWIKLAQELDLSNRATIPNELGVDVGGGGDKSVIAHRIGPRVRIIERNQNPNTMVQLGYIIQALKSTGATIAKVDYLGIGKGIVDRAQEAVLNKEPDYQYASKIVGISVGRPAVKKDEFISLKAEGFWELRQRFEDGEIDIDPYDDDLAAQLIDIKWRPSLGRVAIESKEEMRKRGRNSPDEADAVMLAFLTPPVDPDAPQVIDVTWGR